MSRVVSLWFPTLATDRLRAQGGWPADRPLVTAAAEQGRRVVAACCAEAQATGLRVGMPLAQARVLVAGLQVADADPQADAVLLAGIADRVARRWTPMVRVDGADGLLLDVGAASHLFGGEVRLLTQIAAAARATGLAMRGVAADGARAAWALAHHGADAILIVPPGGDVAATAPLPPAALGLDVGTIEALARLGFATVGAITAAPRAPLVRRFGAVLSHRLEAIAGHHAEPIPLRLPADAPRARRALVEPIGTAEALATVIGDLAADLCVRLEARGQGARRALLSCRRVDAQATTVLVGLARPTRDPAHLADLLRRRIAEIDPGFGIEAMTLTAIAVRALPPSQNEAALPATTASVVADGNVLAFPARLPPQATVDPPDLALLVDRLANRFGGAALHRAAPAESDAPGRMVRCLPPLARPAGGGWRGDWPRPIRLLRRPDRIERFIADLPDHAPDFFVWRGRRLTVTGADGPERIFGEWWRGGARQRVRDYFQVEVEGGGRYWLFRLGDGSDPSTGPGDWYVHGAFG